MAYVTVAHLSGFGSIRARAGVRQAGHVSRTRPHRGISSPPARAFPAHFPESAAHDLPFPLFLCMSVGATIALGIYMKSVTFPSAGPVAPVNGRVALHYIPVQRRIDNSPEKIPGKPEKAKKNIVENPVDLTGNPQLAQRHEEPLAEKTNAKPVRRVYGLQKVYSRGLGTSGAMADAIIGKRGNTLAKEFYTLNATAEHIKGRVVSATTVTKAPAFRKKVPPEYTKEMIDNRVEGVVKVKVLVDIDGRVKQATAINDLGFETASRALKAILETLFFPALRDDEPVAVWIVVPIRFIMIG